MCLRSVAVAAVAAVSQAVTVAVLVAVLAADLSKRFILRLTQALSLVLAVLPAFQELLKVSQVQVLVMQQLARLVAVLVATHRQELTATSL
jgi:hypothetical protein